jgi:hypothetical protein
LSRTSNPCWVLMAPTYSPSYSWDQEDCGSRPILANSSRDPIPKIAKANGLDVYSSGRAAALWVQSHKFKSQFYKKKCKILTQRKINFHINLFCNQYWVLDWKANIYSTTSMSGKKIISSKIGRKEIKVRLQS